MSDRYARSRDIVAPEIIQSYTPVIVGCGAIGSQVARMLAHMGSHMKLVDFDSVDEVNLGCQGFNEDSLGKTKVDALHEILIGINSTINVSTTSLPFDGAQVGDGAVVFCCVDNIETRGVIFGAVKERVGFFVDGRMKGGDTIRIVQARHDRPSSVEYYPLTLFKVEEAANGACTARTTIYGAYVAAAMMVAEYVRWLKGVPVFTQDFAVSLPANEMFAIDEVAIAKADEAEKIDASVKVEVKLEEGAEVPT